ncbi:MAG: helix-turn-helix transcriptional regulator [Hungatella sp.]|nr:helix-turn-helix transcriptional regulator [Hungatella sp.]
MNVYKKSFGQEVCRLSIGQRLKEARKSRKISQDILAEKIGASRGVITNIEHDKIAKPQPMVINAICNVLEINKEWLLDGLGPMNVPADKNQDTQILSEIYEQAQKLSEEEQLFILDMIKSYTKHIK